MGPPFPRSAQPVWVSPGHVRDLSPHSAIITAAHAVTTGAHAGNGKTHLGHLQTGLKRTLTTVTFTMAKPKNSLNARDLVSGGSWQSQVTRQGRVALGAGMPQMMFGSKRKEHDVVDNAALALTAGRLGGRRPDHPPQTGASGECPAAARLLLRRPGSLPDLGGRGTVTSLTAWPWQ